MNLLRKIGWQYFIRSLKAYRDIHGRTGLKEFWVFQAYVTLILLIFNLIPLYYYMPLDWYFEMVGLDKLVFDDIIYLLRESSLVQAMSMLENRILKIEHLMLDVMQNGIRHYYLQTIVALYLMFPGLAILFRRFHDIGRSGWWHLLIFVLPPLGALAVLVATLQESQKQTNKWGTPPSKI